MNCGGCNPNLLCGITSTYSVDCESFRVGRECFRRTSLGTRLELSSTLRDYLLIVMAAAPSSRASCADAELRSPYAQPSNRPPPYRVRVYNEELYRQLILHQRQDEPPRGLSKPSSPSGSYGRSTKSKPSHPSLQQRSESKIKAGEEGKRKRREEQYRQQAAQQHVLQERLVRDKRLEDAAKMESIFFKLSGEVAEGHKFVDELDRVLGIADEAERSKKLKQFQEWNTHVHDLIQGRIDTALEQITSKEINERRRADLQKFLTATNTKVAIFRDIIIESEYDPLEPNRRSIKARVTQLCDPCSRVLDKRVEENALLSAGEGVSGGTPLAREILDVELWEAQRIKDTPHGFFAKMMNRENNKSKTGCKTATSKTYQSSLKMDDYNIDRGRDIVTKEFPKGKKTYMAGDEYAPLTSDSQMIIGMGS